MKSNGNGWLRGRSEILGRYAQGLPDGQDRIQVAFDGPDYGWMPVHFIKNGVDMGFVEFSDVYDCFEPLREWLESVACNQCSNASVVNLDCEDWQAVLYYEPIWFFDHSCKRELWPGNCGIFSVYDESDDRFILDAYCETGTFVRDFYKCLTDFARVMTDKIEFVEDWVPQSWQAKFGDPEDDPRMREMFIGLVRSQKIEDYLKEIGSRR